MDKKINKQEVKKSSPMNFSFKFKYFPENVEDEVIQDLTLKLLYLQVLARAVFTYNFTTF